MANILILGAGSMGTAFSFPCSDNKHSVSIIGTHLENDFIDQINSSRKHPVLDCEVPKGVTFLKFNKLEEEANKKIDLIAVAVISKGIEWASLEITATIMRSTFLLISSPNFSNFENFTPFGISQFKAGCFFLELILSIKLFSKCVPIMDTA